MLSCSTHLIYIIIKVILLPNEFFNDDNAPMVDNGHFGDEDVAVLASIVVC